MGVICLPWSCTDWLLLSDCCEYACRCACEELFYPSALCSTTGEDASVTMYSTGVVLRDAACW